MSFQAVGLKPLTALAIPIPLNIYPRFRDRRRGKLYIAAAEEDAHRRLGASHWRNARGGQGK
jgi:hypothetical protein